MPTWQLWQRRTGETIGRAVESCVVFDNGILVPLLYCHTVYDVWVFRQVNDHSAPSIGPLLTLSGYQPLSHPRLQTCPPGVMH